MIPPLIGNVDEATVCANPLPNDNVWPHVNSDNSKTKTNEKWSITAILWHDTGL